MRGLKNNHYDTPAGVHHSCVPLLPRTITHRVAPLRALLVAYSCKHVQPSDIAMAEERLAELKRQLATLQRDNEELRQAQNNNVEEQDAAAAAVAELLRIYSYPGAD